MNEFEMWLSQTYHTTVSDILLLGALAVSRLLTLFAQAIYDKGRPVGILKYAVLGTVDLRRDFKRSMQIAWDAVAMWEELMPLRSHAAMPAALLSACIALAVEWKWFDVAVLLALGFLGMLRKGELLRLRKGDLVFIGNWVMAPSADFFVRIVDPKSKRLGARMQHVRIANEPIVAAFVERSTEHLQEDALLFKGSPAQFASALNALLLFFGIPKAWQSKVSWSSLRGGGATYLYLMDMPLQRVSWLGRWRQQRTLEIYVQEVATLKFLDNLETAARHSIRLFAGNAAALMKQNARRAAFRR